MTGWICSHWGALGRVGSRDHNRRLSRFQRHRRQHRRLRPRMMPCKPNALRTESPTRIAVQREGRPHVPTGMCCVGQVVIVMPLEGGVLSVTTAVIHPRIVVATVVRAQEMMERKGRLLQQCQHHQRHRPRRHPRRHLEPPRPRLISQPSRPLARRPPSFGQVVSSSSYWAGGAHLGQPRPSQRPQ